MVSSEGTVSSVVSGLTWTMVTGIIFPFESQMVVIPRLIPITPHLRESGDHCGGDAGGLSTMGL